MREYSPWEIGVSAAETRMYLIKREIRKGVFECYPPNRREAVWRGTQAEAEKQLLLLLAKGEEDE